MRIHKDDISPWLFEVIIDGVIIVKPLIKIYDPIEEMINQREYMEKLILTMCKHEEYPRLYLNEESKNRSYGNKYIKRRFR